MPCFLDEGGTKSFQNFGKISKDRLPQCLSSPFCFNQVDFIRGELAYELKKIFKATNSKILNKSTIDVLKNH